MTGGPLSYIPRWPVRVPPPPVVPVEWERLREGMAAYYARRDALDAEAARVLRRVKRRVKSRTRRRNGKAK